MNGRRLILLAVLLPSLLALASALAAEHLFGVLGCDLCVHQRLPYALAAACGAAALIRPSPFVLRLSFTLCAGLFALGCGLAVYHVGIQQGWWAEAGLCAGSLPAPPADLRAVAGERRPACDEIDWSMLGLSLAALNAIYSATLACAAAWLATHCSLARKAREKRA